jgi:four helix bundle protein
MRRSSVSICSNIAEGCSRSGIRDLTRFLEIGLGSAFELQVQIDLAVALGMIPTEHPMIDECDRLKRSLIRLIVSVRPVTADLDDQPKTSGS